ncbi:MAG: hypothetical protein OCD76_11575 [Reichenbachiella sp.]
MIKENSLLVFVKLSCRLLAICFFVQIICSQELVSQAALDKKVYLTSSDISDFNRKLSLGYCAFYVQSEDVDSSIVKHLKEWLLESPERTMVWFLSENGSSVLDQIKKLNIPHRFIQPESNASLSTSNAVDRGQFLLFGNSIDSDLNNNDTFDVINFSDSLGSQLSDKSFIVIRDNSTDDRSLSQLDSFIIKTGKLPNFIETGRPEFFQDIVDSINQVSWYRGTVMFGDHTLDNVSWQHDTRLRTNGKFYVSQARISPYKRGYVFSPDVMNFNSQNQGRIKTFQSDRLLLNSRLKLHLDFDENIVNQVNPEHKNLYSFLEYGYDEERGSHAVFNGRDSYIDFGVPAIMDTKAVTLSVWIKPGQVDGVYGIVGMGEVFSAKVFERGLQFTSPDIRDHVLKGPMIMKNVWQHIAFVYMAEKQVLFYHNGRLVGEFVASGVSESLRSLVVGTNLWDEFYEGKMDDLYLWDRALSDEEIEEIYLRSNVPVGSDFFGLNSYSGLAMFFVISLLGLIFYRKRSKSSSTKIAHERKRLRKISADSTGTGVYLFGGFKLTNKSGKELTSLFSPKKKELFVLVLLYTFRKQGISSKEMANILWEGHSDDSAKNNRSTQVKRLREILIEDTGIRIAYKDKLWCIEMDEDVHWDFLRYQELLSDFELVTAEDATVVVEELMLVINQGVLLPHMHYEWLDPIKNHLSEELLEVLRPLFIENKFQLENQVLLRLTNVVFSFDPLNELALKHKIQILQEEGRHTLAMNAYEEYSNAYFHFYDQKYHIPFAEFEQHRLV